MAFLKKDGDLFFWSKILLQVFSVFIAVSLWFFVNVDSGGDAEKELSSEVHFLNLSSELTLKIDNERINVGVLGPRDALANLTPRDVLSEVDIRGLGPGKYRLPVKVVLPGVARLNYVKPAHVEISLVRYGERVLPVHVSITEGLPVGLLMDSVEFVPKEVVVKGPEESLSSIAEAVVQPTLKELQKGERLNLPVKLIESDGTVSELLSSPTNINFSAVLRKGLPRKRIPVGVSTTGKPNANYDVASIVVSPSFIEIEGSEKALSSVEKIETETIDLADFKQDRSMILPLRGTLPDGVQILGEASVSVNVNLTLKTSTKLFAKVPVVTRGRSVYPGWTVSPETVDIQVEGPAGLVDSMSVEQLPFSVYVDVTNIVSRQLRVPVTVKMDIKGIKVLTVDPERVTVRAKVE